MVWKKNFQKYCTHCRPRWSRGNVLASRSKVREFKPTEVDGFFQDVKILSTSLPGGTLRLGPESESSGSLKNLKPEKKTGL